MKKIKNFHFINKSNFPELQRFGYWLAFGNVIQKESF